MKRILTLSVAALLLAGTSMAQDTKKAGKEKGTKEWKKDGKAHRKHNGHKAGMAKELNLTEAQKAELKNVNQDYKAKAKALKEERKAKAEAVLTAEQKARIAEMKAARKNEDRQKGKDRFEKAKKEMNLTEAQGQQIKAINENYRLKAKAIRDNQSLTQEQKKEQFKALNEQRKNELKSVLTAEQLSKMEARKKEGRGGKGKRSGK